LGLARLSGGTSPGTSRPIGLPLLLGFAIASIGGPVALVYQLLPSALGSAAEPSIGLVLLVALVLFAFPVGIWFHFSERIASAGGLYAFVEAAAGKTAARVHGVIWIVSYFLYLPATVTAIVHETLPDLAPGIRPYRTTLELVLPLVFVALVLLPLRASLAGVLVLAAGQLVLVLVLGGLEIANVGFPLSSLALHGNAGEATRGTGTVTLLFLCASLPLYLGAEVRGGGRTIGRAIVAATALVGAYALFAAIPLAAVPATLRGADLPAQAIGRAYGDHALGVVAGVATVLSILVLVFAEYAALGRLLTAMAPVRLTPSLLAIGALFLVFDALALLGPDGFYGNALRPSLAALYVSQLIVFAVYPLWKWSRRAAVAVPVALVAAVPLVYGFYLVAADRIAS
jgi:amino acid transporter